ncbi:MAG: flagellar assembly protein FliW [Candidatus Hydrogenedentes bacterium]|nr:flagellar assembly protein FliW [Candidatus Hydrogenedentota bacterium]
MKIATTRFGDIEVKKSEIIVFVKPILGFQAYKKFIILPAGSDCPIFWLQSVEDGKLAFLMVDPYYIIPTYNVPFTTQDLSELEADKTEDITVYTLLVVPEDPKQIRTNLRAPIVINKKKNLAKQMILDKTEYPVQWFLSHPNNSSNERQEV